MRKKHLIALGAIAAVLTVADMNNAVIWQTNTCQAATQQTPKTPKDGYYFRTNRSVSITSDAGVHHGSYTIYIHKEKEYINFKGTWICIHRKSSFTLLGVRYYIK